MRAGLNTLLVFMLLLGGCASVPPGELPANDPAAGSVWPKPPARGRLTYIGSVEGPVDLGIRKNFLRQLGELISGSRQVRLVRPMAVLRTLDGIVYVADPGARGVHRFDPQSGNYRLIQAQNERPLPSPVALAARADGTVYVSDSRLAAIYVISPGSREAYPLALDIQLSRPSGLVFDDEGGQLYVVDTRNHEIKVFSTDGSALGRFGHRGSGDGEFNYPTMIWINDAGQLLVADSMNFRVQLFDRSGQFLSQFGEAGSSAGYFAQPKGIATTSNGDVYVVDSVLHAVQVFDPSGEFLFKLGLRGEAAGEFWLPVGIFIDADDTIYVADSYNGRLQIFRYLGGQQP